MGEVDEDSASSSSLPSPSSPENLNIPPETVFPGESSFGNNFTINYSPEYSSSSFFSYRFWTSEVSSPPLASPTVNRITYEDSSPPFNGITSDDNSYFHNHESLFLKDHHQYGPDFGLREDLRRMKIKEDVEQSETHRDPIGSIFVPNHTDLALDTFSKHYEPSNGVIGDGRFVSGGSPSGLFRRQKDSSDSRLKHDQNMFKNDQFKVPDCIAKCWEHGNSSRSNGQEISRSYMSPLFLQEGDSPFVMGSSTSVSYEPFSFSMDNQTSSTPSMVSAHGNHTEIHQGDVYSMAKDPYGCRYLQSIFDEGSSTSKTMIIKEATVHAVELMMDSSGNYLMQKILRVCTENQRTQIVVEITSKHGQLIQISLNSNGSRVVQRLVENIKTLNQISLVKSALRPGFLVLIKDLNGSRVIQSCLQYLDAHDNKFILEGATMFCNEIATHRHGCCVLQDCINYSIRRRQQHEKLITEIAINCLFLSKDPFGNYVVQLVMEQRSFPSVIKIILTKLKGHYVELSIQKFGSHVVEKILRNSAESRRQIIQELILVSNFDQLLQDIYANFVIKSALDVTEGSSLQDELVKVIRPLSFLRNNPCCKKIFAKIEQILEDRAQMAEAVARIRARIVETRAPTRAQMSEARVQTGAQTRAQMLKADAQMSEARAQIRAQISEARAQMSEARAQTRAQISEAGAQMSEARAQTRAQMSETGAQMSEARAQTRAQMSEAEAQTRAQN